MKIVKCMAIDIQMPDYETRCAIVKAKAELSNTELDSDVVEYLATNFKRIFVNWKAL